MPRGWWGAAPGGGGLTPLRGASGVRRCSSQSRQPSGAVSQGSATRVSRVRSVRACRHPAPAPQRAPLQAGVARCGGGGRASPGGCLPLLRGASDVRCSPPPRLSAHWAGCSGPPPTCCGRGCVGVGAQHCPPGLHALRGLRAAGVVGGRPRGGWPATIVRGVWCQALSLPRAPVLWSGQAGFRDPCVPGAVGAGVGIQHRPHSMCPCGPALLPVGVAEGRPRGGCLPPL